MAATFIFVYMYMYVCMYVCMYCIVCMYILKTATQQLVSFHTYSYVQLSLIVEAL